jgi:protein AroM
MDCIGYTLAMKQAVKEITGVPVILARSVVARMLAELL